MTTDSIPTPSINPSPPDEASPTPRLSFLVPVYNGGRTLSTALESIAAQPDAATDIEVLISDDASTDDSATVAEQLLPRLPQGRLFRQPTNRGGAANWQYLLERARGVFVFLLSQDDALDPAFLPSVRAVWSRHPEADMIFGPIMLRDAEFDTIERLSLSTPLGPADGATRAREQLASHHMVMSTVYRRRVLLDAGGWDPSVGSHADCTAFCRTALRAESTVHTDACLLHFRFSPSSWSSRLARAHRERAEWYRRKLDLVRDDAARLHPDLGPFIATMYRRHAEIELGGLEIALAAGTASGAEVRAGMRGLLAVFPEGRRSRMAAKVWAASIVGTWWLRGVRRLLGRPDPYGSPLSRMVRATAARPESP